MPVSPALSTAAALIGDRWSLLIVAALQDGPMRFGDLSRSVGAIAPNVLSARLRELTARRIVLAEPYQIRPPRMTYDLTPAGRQLRPVLTTMELWAAALDGVHTGVHSGTHTGATIAPWHAACGSTLEVHAWCPSCEVVVDSRNAGDTTFL